MSKKVVVTTALVAALGVALVAPSSVEAQVIFKPTPPPNTAYKTEVWTCPAMVLPTLTPYNEWLRSAPQGWLDRAAIVQGDSVSMFQCQYGLDKNNPAARQAFTMHRAIPANFTNCKLSGPGNTTMTCTVK